MYKKGGKGSVFIEREGRVQTSVSMKGRKG